jgi:hypothetical protein
MFERDKAARDYKYATRLADEDVVRQRGVRDENWQFQTGTKDPYYREQARVARDDPSLNMSTLAMLDSHGLDDAVKQFQNVLPQQQVVDMGDRVGAFDTMTGMFGEQEGKGLDPTQKYQSDASMSNARTAAGAQNYATSVRQALGELDASLTREGRAMEQSNRMNGWTPAGVDNNGVALEHNPFQGYRSSVDDAGVAVTPGGQGSGPKHTGKTMVGADGQVYSLTDMGPVPTGIQGQQDAKGMTDAYSAVYPFGAEADDPRAAEMQSAIQEAAFGRGAPVPQQPSPIRQAGEELGGPPPAAPNGPKRVIDATTWSELSAGGITPDEIQELWQAYKAGEIELTPEVLNNFTGHPGGGGY